jgi:hypothetical protein
MAEFFVRHTLNYNKTVRFNITLRYFVIKGEEGEHMWTFEIGTTHEDMNGDSISSKKVHNISAENLDEVIETALADLCSQIDWTPLVDDKEAPFVDSFSPSGTDVSIGSNIRIIIKDGLPSAGIDLSNMKIILNNGMQNFDITSEVETVDAYYNEYELKWVTPLRVYKTYD